VTRARDVATQGGLVLVNSTAFSAQSTISIDNCFSATYDNYRIVVSYSNTNTDAIPSIRLRSGGTNNSSSTYDFTRSRSYSNLLYSSSGFGGTSGTSWLSASSGYRNMAVLDIANPFLSLSTLINFDATVSIDSTATVKWFGGIAHRTASSFDGISFILDVGTITGTIEVYGYK